ncbi:hypothetical protein THRCLA_09499 [Thraustotheca clavata]|uniref:Uncharacterized protein n=1 Tax=Thraustotheca clavata TaxID=74557 RepID=A0A1V9YWB2_9STRA|nr:hypothetical protein THRCLA_09499 [Thraustotheca clavata]
MAASVYVPPFERQQREAMKDTRMHESLVQRCDLGLAAARTRHGLPRVRSKGHTSRVPSLMSLLVQREQRGNLTEPESLALQESFLPFGSNSNFFEVDQLHARLYCGEFTRDGRQFLVAGQREDILVYDTMTWKRVHSLPARDVNWTITDAHFTPDGNNVVYSSISSTVRMVSANKEIAFRLGRPKRTISNRGRIVRDYAVWCLGINAMGTEFLAGTGSNSVVLHDMTTNTTVCHLMGHTDDVNAITFVDGPFYSNVFVSGSDDHLIKLWDRRMMSETNARPQGVFPGHTEGITHLSSREDGYYFISNAKDQTCKLWDLRKCVDEEQLLHVPPRYHWDYRWEEYPGYASSESLTPHPQDQSIMTYRGHIVQQTLVRCYFSPMHSTAQRYIYSGSADGEVYIYDVLTGAIVEQLELDSQGLTRDVRWHPYLPMIVSPDFFGKLCVWQKDPSL